MDLTQVENNIQNYDRHIKRFKDLHRDDKKCTIILVATKSDALPENERLSALGQLLTFAENNQIDPNNIIITSVVNNTCRNKNSSADEPLSNMTSYVHRLIEEASTAKIIDDFVHLPLPSASEVWSPELKKQMLEQFKSSESRDKKFQNLLNGLAGLVIGAVLGVLSAIIIHNPITCFLSAWRVTDWQEWGLANVLRVYFLAPFVNPLIAILYGLKDGVVFGAKQGISTELLQIPKNMAKPFELRAIITGVIGSILIAGLVGAAVFGVLSLLSISLPLLIGAAGAVALVATVGYEGYDFLQTSHELQQALSKFKNNKVYEELIAQPKQIPMVTVKRATNHHHHGYVKLADKGFMAVNVYEKANIPRSLSSVFQLPPTDSKTYDMELREKPLEYTNL